MQVIKQSHQIMFLTPDVAKLIEEAGRTCYKSESKITKESASKFVEMLIKRGHHSVIEHAIATVKFITDRGVTHELVRHRLASFSQESTRYCNYGSEDIEFILPVWTTDNVLGNWTADVDLGDLYACNEISRAEGTWINACIDSEEAYKFLLNNGNWRPEQARSVLNNSLKTEIVVTANLREWRHILTLRCSKAAHPQIRELMLPLLADLKKDIPVVFDDM